MVEAVDNINSNTAVKLYTFRFGSSDKTIQLTQQQLDSIPYLTTLIAHKDDFLSCRNKNGEYVLSHPIQYNWFIFILHTITIENPYTLFNELSEDNNILDILQLHDYLGIESFPLPLLKYEHLALSKSTGIGNQQHQIEYREANLSEARQTAAEFVIALSNNEYNLHVDNTRKRIFTIIEKLFSNAALFSSRFRYHTLTILEECCYSFFSKNRQNLLTTAFQNTQYSKIDLFLYLDDDDDQSYPDDFEKTFAWRGSYVYKEEKQTNSLMTNPGQTSSNIFGKSNIFSYAFYGVLPRILWLDTYIASSRSLFHFYDTPDFLSTAFLDNYMPFSGHENQQIQKKNEARSARSGHFNTLPKRPKVDKFKNRCGPKTQKYR